MLKEKVIIDTDIGDDIDDALALVMALNSPEIEVLGITTVFRNVQARARMTLRLLKTLNRSDIPVVPGIGETISSPPIDTLFTEINTNELPGQYMDEMDNETITYDGDAIDFLQKTLIESEEPITLIPIGPLTNIATLLLKNPFIKSKIKRIVLMGGAYFKNVSEYNILCDPDAAKIVFSSNIPIVGVGLDVTTKCQLTEDEVETIRAKGTDSSEFLSGLINKFMSCAHHLPYLHDPLAIAVAIDTSLVTLQKKRIGIETRGEFTRGMTFNISDSRWWEKTNESYNVMVCASVDRDRLVKFFLERI